MGQREEKEEPKWMHLRFGVFYSQSAPPHTISKNTIM